MGALRCQDGPKMAPRWAEIRWPQDGPSSPDMVQRCPQDVPRWSKIAPKGTQDGQKPNQDGPIYRHLPRKFRSLCKKYACSSLLPMIGLKNLRRSIRMKGFVEYLWCRWSTGLCRTYIFSYISDWGASESQGRPWETRGARNSPEYFKTFHQNPPPQKTNLQQFQVAPL